MEKKSKSRLDEADLPPKRTLVNSCVYNSNSKHVFHQIAWISIGDFVKLDKTKNVQASYPHGVTDDGELAFIGKTRSILSSSNRITDQVGTVKRSTRKMEICHQNKVFDIQLFLVLGFEDMKNVFWKPIHANKFPMFALKLGVDAIRQAIVYVGRCFDQNLIYVGHLTGSSGGLVVPLDRKQQTFTNFQVLCMKASPASLRHLCRVRIRLQLNNENIKADQLEHFFDKNLIKYIKFKSYLKWNEQLHAGECLISKNGVYKLSLERDGRLLYYFNEERDYLFLYENVESLWLSDLKLMVCFKDLTSKIFLTDCEHLNVVLDNAKFKLEDDGCMKLVSPHHDSVIVFQFRDDAFTYWNLSTPKFDFVYFLEDKRASSNQTGESTDDDDDSDTSSGSSTSHSNSSQDSD